MKANRIINGDNVDVLKGFPDECIDLVLTSTDKIAFEHPAIMPEKLAEDHIISWSNEGDLVLDPFLGSGTVSKMCYLLNRQWIGIDISPEYCELAEKRLILTKRDRGILGVDDICEIEFDEPIQ